MGILKTIGKKLVLFKIYLGRANGYIAMLNTGMLLMLILSKLNEYGVSFSLKKYGLLLYVVTICLFVLVGYLDDKLGIQRYEISQVQQQNEDIQNILKNIKEIKEKI